MVGVRFRSREAAPGICISDTVGHERTELQFKQTRSWTRTEPDAFQFPVSDAVKTTLSGFQLTPFSSTFIRDSAGRALLAVAPGADLQLPKNEYCLELCTPVKTYLRFSCGGGVEATTERLSLEFDEPTSVVIGARSPQTKPNNTIITSSNPEDIMSALSCLGNAIQTNSPGRSYSTMRGYPPTIELGSELSIPDGVRSPKSPIVLELPSSLEFIYPATSLGYYLDAEIRPGEKPRLSIGDEVLLEINPEEFHDEVERLLQHVFMLDCLTRTVGHYPFKSQAYRQLHKELTFDIDELYNASLETRLRSYLSAPFDLVEPELPNWSVTAYVEPDPEHVESLSHLAYQLAFVRTEPAERVTGPQARKSGLKSFMSYHDGGRTRIAEDVYDKRASFVEVPSSSNTDVDLWIGDDAPLEANKMLVDGYTNRLQRDPLERTTISVGIVCNETWMDSEVSATKDRYGVRDDLPFTIETRDNLRCEELGQFLGSDVDFLHYIGHANKNGLKCSDGYLDINSVSTIGPDMFFLNACQSYQPGLAMVRDGCIGGIVTLSDVTHDEAATVGRTVARLLDLGFPLRNALMIARRRSIIGGQYLAVGDDSAALVQAESGFPYECVVREAGDGYELQIQTYPTNRHHLGSLFRPNVGSARQQYLGPKRIGQFELSGEDLVSFLELENAPVRYEGDFYWAFELAKEIG